MITTMGIDESKYKEWKQKLSILKFDPQYLLLPTNDQF